MGDVMDELQLAEASAYSTMYQQRQEIRQNQRRMAEVLLRFADPIPEPPPGNEPAGTQPQANTRERTGPL